ncbi:MAG: hypothetical protein J6A43_00735 [Clostridia bacterium]|nr:hypothetical protein [Clostridia bacterium]
MKKCKLVFTVVTVLLLSLIMAVTASAADAPTRENAEEIFFDMGFSTWGNGYFGCSMEEPEGGIAPDEVVFQYMYLSGTLNDYYDEESGYYTIAYDEYISLVDKTFVNHSDMKAYLVEFDYMDAETNVLNWFRGGFGGPCTWVPTEYYVNGDYCYVTGMFVDMEIEYYPDFAEMIVDEDYIYVGEYPAVILDELILTLQNTEDGWKILEYREAGYHVVEDMLYSFDEMFFRFTIEDNGNVTVNECEDSTDFVTKFYGNASAWHPEISNHSYNIKADENYVIESVILNDANGETVLEPVDDVYTFDVVGIATLKVTTRGIPAIKEHEGNLVYFIGNDIATDFTGLVEFDNFVYYVENGIVKQDYTGLVYYNDIWYYVENGIINWDYTGLVYHNNAWYYVENGVLDWGYTGLVEYYSVFYYVENGILNWDYTGLVEYYSVFYYVENGILNWGYTGLVEHYGTWYYVENGVLNFITGLYGDENSGIVYFINNGAVDTSFTGFVEIEGYWLYVEEGIWDYTFKGKVDLEDGTFAYIEEGVVVDIR